MLLAIMVLTVAIVRNERALQSQGLSSFNPVPPPSPIDFAALNLTGDFEPFPPLEIRVNAGGPRFRDRYGYVWEADTILVDRWGNELGGESGFIGGTTFRTEEPIAGTKESSIYQTERWSGEPEGFRYSAEVPNGRYVVSLYFAEVYPGTFARGARVFDVAVEGVTVLDEFDIYALAGANTALERSFLVDVNDERLDIHFKKGALQNPKVNALSVVRVQ